MYRDMPKGVWVDFNEHIDFVDSKFLNRRHDKALRNNVQQVPKNYLFQNQLGFSKKGLKVDTFRVIAFRKG